MTQVPIRWSDVAADAYLEHALELTDEERRQIEALAGELPRRIVDSHTHIAAASEVAGYPPTLLHHVVSTFPSYSLEDAARVRAALWPDTEVQSLRMAHAVRGYNYEAINRSLATHVESGDDVLAVYGLPDDIEYTISILSWPQAAALKMYYAYRDPPYETLEEIFPTPVLEKAEELAIPIILHLPRPLPHTTQCVLNLRARFPDLVIILAHVGGHGGQPRSGSAEQALHDLAGANIYVDTALIYDSALVSAALRALGPSRVLFGTDEPLSLIRAAPYIHPRLGPRLYAPRYHWAVDDNPPRKVTTRPTQLLHLLQTEAVLAAVRSYGAGAIEAVFATNAHALFGSGTQRGAGR